MTKDDKLLIATVTFVVAGLAGGYLIGGGTVVAITILIVCAAVILTLVGA